MRGAPLRRTMVLPLVVGLALPLGRSAHADEADAGHRRSATHLLALAPLDPSAAEQAFEEARRAYNLGRWREAADGFEKAYRLSGDPVLLYDRAQALRQDGRTAEAITAYKAFLREQPKAANRTMVEEQIRALENRLKEEEGARSTPGTLPPRGASRPPSAADIAEPSATAHANLPPPTEDVPAEPRSRWLTWVGLSLTVALAGGAIATGLSVNSRFNELRRSCGGTASGCSEDQIAGLRTRVRVTNVLWGLAGVSAVVTGIVVLVEPRSEQVALAWRF